MWRLQRSLVTCHQSWKGLIQVSAKMDQKGKTIVRQKCNRLSNFQDLQPIWVRPSSGKNSINVLEWRRHVTRQQLMVARYFISHQPLNWFSYNRFTRFTNWCPFYETSLKYQLSPINMQFKIGLWQYHDCKLRFMIVRLLLPIATFCGC